MKVIISKSARKFIDSMEANNKRLILQKLEAFVVSLNTNDFSSLKSFDILSLKGKLSGWHRLRIGKFRIVFKYSNKELTIEQIDFRGNIY